MPYTRLSSLVIVGGGTAGWMAAAALAHHLRDQPVSITLVESSVLGTVGVGEATLPGIRNFNASLGIDEVAFVKATQATFKLGIDFRGWQRQDRRFFHPFSDYGAPLNGVHFHALYQRVQQAGLAVGALDEYSFAAALAARGGFAQPHANPANPLADYKYAFHFDALAYANLLRDYAQALGVIRIDDQVTDVALDPDCGDINALHLAGGARLAGDFFIDCSGFRSLLLGQALGVAFDDWSHWLPVDGAWALASKPLPQAGAYTTASARTGGWQWQIPLQQRTGNGYVFSSAFIDPEAARQQLTDSVGGALTEPQRLRFTTGRRRQFWHKNCVALGLASGFLEPLESTSIALIQTGLSKLLMFMPTAGVNPAEVAECNRLAALEMENMRDFLILHYCRSARTDGELWHYCRNMALPDSLAHKIAVYEARGHIVQHELESFQPASWLTFYQGLGVQPQAVDLQAQSLPIEQVVAHCAQVRSVIAEAASQAGSHSAFIDRHCRVAPAA